MGVLRNMGRYRIKQKNKVPFDKRSAPLTSSEGLTIDHAAGVTVNIYQSIEMLTKLKSK